MSRSNTRLSRARPEEVEDFVQLYSTAFSDPAADIIMRMVYPVELLDPAVQRRLQASLHASSSTNDERYFASDVHTGELLGVSWWQIVTEPTRRQETIDAAYEEAVVARKQLPEVSGMNLEMDLAYLRAAHYSTHSVTRGQPFMELKILAVHPAHQGKGIGSMLIKPGLQKADELGLQVFVISALQGKPVYERFGFGVVEVLPLDARDYGGHSEGRHWSMLRTARKGELMKYKT